MSKIISIIVLTTLLLMSTVTAVVAAPPLQGGEEGQEQTQPGEEMAGQEYIVQSGDWLSRIAEKYWLNRNPGGIG